MRIKILLGLLALGVAWFGVWHEKNYGIVPLWEAPKLLSSMRAKEFCACHFMLGRDREYCLKDVLKGYPVFNYSVDAKKRVVTFSNYLSSSSAHARGPRLGCLLIK